MFLLLSLSLLLPLNSIATEDDVCDLDAIYNSSYTPWLPRNILESYLQGVAFDWEVPYTEDERALLESDIRTMYSRILEKEPVNSP